MLKVKTWHKGSVILCPQHPAWQIADALAENLADLSAAHDRLNGEIEGVSVLNEPKRWRELADQINPLRKQLNAAIEARMQEFIDLLPDLSTSGHLEAYAALCEMVPESPDWTNAELLKIRFRGIMHDCAFRGLSSGMSSGVGTGRKYEIPARYVHPKQAEMDARKQAIKDKAAATREAKRKAEADAYNAQLLARRLKAIEAMDTTPGQYLQKPGLYGAGPVVRLEGIDAENGYLIVTAFDKVEDYPDGSRGSYRVRYYPQAQTMRQNPDAGWTVIDPPYIMDSVEREIEQIASKLRWADRYCAKDSEAHSDYCQRAIDDYFRYVDDLAVHAAVSAIDAALAAPEKEAA